MLNVEHIINILRFLSAELTENRELHHSLNLFPSTFPLCALVTPINQMKGFPSGWSLKPDYSHIKIFALAPDPSSPLLEITEVWSKLSS